MHSALLVIEKEELSPADFDRQKAWDGAMASIRQTLKLTNQVQVLAENVFLIPLRSDLSTLSLLIGACLEYRGMAYKVLFLNEAPEWIHRPTKGTPPGWDKDLPRPNNGVV